MTGKGQYSRLKSLNLFHFQTAGRNRRARGPALHPSVTYMVMKFTWQQNSNSGSSEGGAGGKVVMMGGMKANSESCYNPCRNEF